MSINDTIAREMSKSGGKIKIDVDPRLGQISSYDEWAKWLSYESESEKKIISLLKNKKISEFSYDEREQVSLINKNEIFANLFKKYQRGECTQEEYMKVCHYMDTEDIESLMISKLSSEELKSAEEILIYFSKLSKEELSKKVRKVKNKDDYNNLSMVDSFVFHVASRVDFTRNLQKLDQEIREEIKENDAIRQKSFSYTSNPYLKK